MNFKEIFYRKKDLRDRLQAVVTQEWFHECIAHVFAGMVANGTKSEELAGAKKFVEALVELPEPTPEMPAFPGTGLSHDLDNIVPSSRKPETTKTT